MGTSPLTGTCFIDMLTEKEFKSRIDLRDKVDDLEKEIAQLQI